MGHNSCTIAWKKDIPYNGKYISAFDKIVSSNGGDANRYEWRYNLKSWSLGIPDPCFPGKWFIPQGLVPAEWNSPVYSGILDPKTPVRDSGNGMYCWSGVRKAAYPKERKIEVLHWEKLRYILCFSFEMTRCSFESIFRCRAYRPP